MSLTNHTKQINENEKKINKQEKTRRCLLSLALRHLSSLHCRHLLRPALSRLRFLNGAKVIGGEARDAHVVVALQDELDVAKFEGRGGAEFGQTAGSSDHVVDKVVGHLEDELDLVIGLVFCLCRSGKEERLDGTRRHIEGIV